MRQSTIQPTEHSAMDRPRRYIVPREVLLETKTSGDAGLASTCPWFVAVAMVVVVVAYYYWSQTNNNPKRILLHSEVRLRPLNIRQ